MPAYDPQQPPAFTDPPDDEASAPASAQAAADEREDGQETSPWPARVVAAVTILAILAILLAVFLPREKSEVRPQAGPATEDQTAATTPQPAPTTTMQPATPQVVTPAPTPSQLPAPTMPAPQQPQATEQMGPCPTCGGTGTMPCPMKHLPNGNLLNPYFWAEERYYAGDDPLLPEEADMGPCPVCHGTLRTTCAQCKGHKQVPVGEPALANPGAVAAEQAAGQLGAFGDMARQFLGGQ